MKKIYSDKLINWLHKWSLIINDNWSIRYMESFPWHYGKLIIYIKDGLVSIEQRTNMSDKQIENRIKFIKDTCK